MKLFALFLPQFHEIEENNKWWGEGFTEWTNVKKAVPLFKGHVQPKHPIHHNYYNLLDKDTAIHQTQLMKKYGIHGMVYYHYYFCGKKLLEKPAENLLLWKDIDQPFFFCWANHTWNRSWKGSREVLIEQTYGSLDDWKKHFEYLLPFFKDSRYEKIDNKPLFMIYQSNFEEKVEMLEYFNVWCKEAGFDGIYVIEECFDVREGKLDSFKKSMSNNSEKIYITEPLVGRTLAYQNDTIMKKIFYKVETFLRSIKIIKKVKIYDGNRVYKTMINSLTHDDKCIPGIYFEWDNTPRHGERGYIITPPQKELFFQYINKIKHSDYAIINSWNEWAEGMMIEPSIEDNYKYLEWIKEAMEKIND